MFKLPDKPESALLFSMFWRVQLLPYKIVSLQGPVFQFLQIVAYGLLEFYDDPDKSSEAIFKQIVTIPESNGLSINQISIYGADNASVNYGWHSSVFQKLRAANPRIVKGNCECHILNNTVRSLIEVTDSCSKEKHKI